MRLQIRGSYPPDWPAIAAGVKRAADCRCIRCGHPFSERGRPLPCRAGCDPSRGAHRAPAPQPYGGTNYGVHHLDGDKANCRWWNLLALCNHCHLTVQAKLIPERPYLWQHTPWFRIYAAGFYAWHYGGEEITREQAMLHTAHYIAMGQPWLAGAAS